MKVRVVGSIDAAEHPQILGELFMSYWYLERDRQPGGWQCVRFVEIRSPPTANYASYSEPGNRNHKNTYAPTASRRSSVQHFADGLRTRTDLKGVFLTSIHEIPYCANEEHAEQQSIPWDALSCTAFT